MTTSSEPALRSPLFLLAMDHRHSLLKSVYDVQGNPTDEQVAEVEAHKLLIFAGLQKAIEQGVNAASVGVLTDELYGAEVARRARAAGIDLAMPIEASGHDWFTLQYGDLSSDEWLDHVDSFSPDQVKILVRDNPDESADDRRKQLADLASVNRELHRRHLTLLIELLVPATSDQLDSVGGDAKRYDAEVRPDLTVQVITAMQGADIEPDVWKIEGLETVEAARTIVAVAQRDGRDAVRCIVLGRDAPQHRLDKWLRIAASVDGFSGFAIGRSVWEKPLEDRIAGKTSDDQLKQAVAENFTHFVNTYRDAKDGAGSN